MLASEALNALFERDQPAYLVRPLSLKKRSKLRLSRGFTVGARIGRGAYGDVYQGHEWRYSPARGWQREEQVYAIKILRADFLCEERTEEEYDAALTAFKSEAEFLLAMQPGPDDKCHVPRMHCDGSGIVDCRSRIYDDISVERLPGRIQAFTIMEYLPGGDLKHWTQNGIVFDELQAYIVLQDLVAALKALHTRGICHRDIKPENLVFDDVSGPGGRAHLRVVDFGLAEWIREAPFLSVTGTKRWMAPEVLQLAEEQEEASGYDESIDIYGIGAILSWLLSSFWDPISQSVASVPANFAMENWMSAEAVAVIEACCSNPPFRATVKDLKPPTKAWRKHLLHESQQSSDKVYAIQPEGRDCRRVAEPERADYIFDRFRMTLPPPATQRSYVGVTAVTNMSSESSQIVTPDGAMQGEGAWAIQEAESELFEGQLAWQAAATRKYNAWRPYYDLL